MKKLVLSLVAAAFAMTGAASAATYDVLGLINKSADGFTSSLVHSQKHNMDMSGYNLGWFSEHASGKWVDGKIGFTGKWRGGDYKALGYINEHTGAGKITFNFEKWLGVKTFYFKDADFGGGPANGFKDHVISLWGSTNTCWKNWRGHNKGTCYGIDLRIKVGSSGGGAEIPLPASAFLLLGGLGAMGIARRKKASA